MTRYLRNILRVGARGRSLFGPTVILIGAQVCGAAADITFDHVKQPVPAQHPTPLAVHKEFSEADLAIIAEIERSTAGAAEVALALRRLSKASGNRAGMQARSDEWEVYQKEIHRIEREKISLNEGATQDWRRLSPILADKNVSDSQKLSLALKYAYAYQWTHLPVELLEHISRTDHLNKEIWNLQGMCAKDDFKACVQAADVFNNVFGANATRRQDAAALYRKACNGGEARACNNLAVMYGDGNNIGQQGPRAELFQAGCELGDPNSCANLAVMHITGLGISTDVPKGVSLLKDACDRWAVSVACGFLGNMYISGDLVAANSKTGLLLMDKGCRLADARSCMNYGFQLAFGTAVKQDRRTGAKYLRKACDLSEGDGCALLAKLVDNSKEIIELHEKACSLGQPNSCLMRGGYYLAARDEEMGWGLLNRACALGLGTACNRMGVHVRKTGDVDGSIAFFQKACDLNDGRGCATLGALHARGIDVKKNTAIGLQLLEKACSLNDAGGFAYLGALYAKGDGVEINFEKALPLLDRACTGDEATGCWIMGSLYSHGKGVPQDDKMALSYVRKACRLGMQDACKVQ